MPAHNVVINAAVLDAVRHVRQECAEIATLCCLAGRSDMMARLIRDGLDAAGAQRRLESLPSLEPADTSHDRAPRSAGNGAAFDLSMIERELAKGRTLQ